MLAFDTMSNNQLNQKLKLMVNTPRYVIYFNTQLSTLWCSYVVDAADRDSIPISQSELHELLEKPSLTGIPLLILGNKIDKSEALAQQALMDQL